MKQILLLEDSWIDFELCWRAIRKIGLISIVKDKNDYMQALRENKFDLVIVDLKVPGFNDFETVVVAHTLQPSVPIIVLTGSMREEEVTKCLDKGATAFILKNSPSKLELEIKKALGITV